ncbi:hypothetical protein BC936DRAFT_137805 [Jimgerdemannia flammicorona]|uniref:Uncharacterized protein n=1 Tax=Jimgerdemannia flammicorona TaxID=994334 RepID=A0A433CWM9_9FUNG|nr:hypothetical protein BC936DRAFT_137805 [Jimgerdemannia flammicorona]
MYHVLLKMDDATIGSLSGLVRYQIRLKSQVNVGSILAFCTMSILCYLNTDPNLAHVILDKIYKWMLELDFLLIVLSRLMGL